MDIEGVQLFSYHLVPQITFQAIEMMTWCDGDRHQDHLIITIFKKLPHSVQPYFEFVLGSREYTSIFVIS